ILAAFDHAPFSKKPEKCEDSAGGGAEMADSRGLAGATWAVTATFARILGLFWQRSRPDAARFGRHTAPSYPASQPGEGREGAADLRSDPGESNRARRY